MGVASPPQVPSGVLQRVRADMRTQLAARGGWPPGEMSFSPRRTREFEREPLPLLLRMRARHGPVFTIRLLYQPVVFALGPEANHYMTVSHASNFRWRDGGMGDLIPLLGDGLLTTDGEYHRRARRIMLPAFHREQLAASTSIMEEEAENAVSRWRPGERLDLYMWTRRLALRIAMRALFGFDPDRDSRDARMAVEFEEALGYWGRDYAVQMLRGPGSPWRAMNRGEGDARPRDLRRDRPPPGERRARRGHPQPPARRVRRGRVAAVGPRAARSGDDAALRGPRHRHVDGRVHVLRAGAQPAGGRSAVAARHGARRNAAHVSAGLDGAPPLDRAVRAARRARPRRRDGQLLLLGEPPPAGGVSRAVELPAREVRPGRQGSAAEGRLRAIRGRLAHLHRDALRAARDQGDRPSDPEPLPAGARRARAAAVDPPDAYAVAAWRAPGGGAGTRVMGAAGLEPAASAL